MEDENPNIIRVKLFKRREDGLGFLIKPRAQKPHVVISSLVSGGLAEQCGLIQIGDVITRVNEIDITAKSYDDAVELLKALPVDAPVALVLLGPEGCSTHLETTFRENGVPRTVRVTKKLPLADGLVGKIRRTFSRASSASPHRSGARVQSPTSRQKKGAGSEHSATLRYIENQCCICDIDQNFPKAECNGNVGKKMSVKDTGSQTKVDSGCDSRLSFESNSSSMSNGIKHHDDADLFSPQIVVTRPGSQSEVQIASEKSRDPTKVRSSGSPGQGWVNPESSSITNAVNSNKNFNTDTASCSDAGGGAKSAANNTAPAGDPIDRRGDQNKSREKCLNEETIACSGSRQTSLSSASNSNNSNSNNSNNNNNNNNNNTRGDMSSADIQVTRVRPQEAPGSPGHKESPNQNLSANGDISEESKRRRDSFTGTLSPKMQRHLSDRRGSANTASLPKKYVKIKNVADERTYTDTLYMKNNEPTGCTDARCIGSMMAAPSPRGPGEIRPKDEVVTQAKDFIDQYYASIKRLNTQAYHKRLQEVLTSIEDTGTYDLTYPELVYGAKHAWRNAPRCIGRIQWSKLQVFDARHINTARGMFEAICNHIKYSNNKGNLRSSITIFPHRTDGRHDYRVWNAQLIRYAGYKQPDGSIIGDPSNVEFTEICQKMGWKGKNGMFDVLPLVLQANGLDPELFEVPQELVMEVKIKHPKFPGIAELGLKWYGLPAVSGMLFDCGGLEFTACPFNGWYMGTEIGARDFCDAQRYNLLEPIAQKLGLDTRKVTSLWKDRALVEINIAVLHSFQASGITITDHHAASESFMKFMENEYKGRGGCPGDWVWVVPPMSGSICPVFHQEMLMYKLKPSYEYQDEPWRTHVWKKDRDRNKSLDRPKRKFGFRELARAVKFSAKLMGKALARRIKCTVLYATETGKSERFANTLCEIFKHAFDAKVVLMEDYDHIDLEHEALVLIVTSTFGNGDPPENGESFAKSLHSLKNSADAKNGEGLSMSYFRMSTASEKEEVLEEVTEDKKDLNEAASPLSNLRYSVFGLGSRAYPSFCAFAHFCDNMLNSLGGERIHKLVEGDELCGQEESFRQWAQEVFRAACETFCVGDAHSIQEATGALSSTDFSWSPGKFRLTPVDGETQVDIPEALSKLHNKAIMPCKLADSVTQLQSTDSSRQTILVKLDTQGAMELQYQPGDHAAIYPFNAAKLVDGILARLQNAPPADQLVKVEVLQERTTPLGIVKTWGNFSKFSTCTIKTAFSNFLDITTPPSQALMHQLSTQATKESDRVKIENLANDIHAYEDWKQERQPNILEVLEEFPSLKVNPTLFMTQLPILQPRFYSISSSPQTFVGEIHATVAVVRYNTMGGTGPEHEGVCSSWLNRLQPGDMVPCSVRAALSFRLPEDPSLPYIMVGPGTGIAPFRSFWQQKKIDMDMKPLPTGGATSGWGESYLFFGCRRDAIDNIYKEELKQAEVDGAITKVFFAFSREPGKPKVYVQDLLMKSSDIVYNCVVKRAGHFYVCGDVEMAEGVANTLCKILTEKGNFTADSAREFLLKLREANRFHEDIFGVGIKSEASARDQAKRAFRYSKAASKPNVKAAPIPTSNISCCLLPFMRKKRISVFPAENPVPL